MRFNMEIERGVCVITLAGEYLDAGNTREFMETAGPLLDKHDRVLLDLSKLRFVDSSGLGALLSCLRRLNEKGGAMKLCGMTEQVKALFDLVHINRLFDVYETRQEGIGAFG